jgi:hypothetical protein
MVSLAHEAVTPAGKPVAVPIPVAPVVVCVILVNGVFIHNIGVLEAVPAVMLGVTQIDATQVTLPQPPVNGIL